jgi:hypothetical protein
LVSLKDNLLTSRFPVLTVALIVARLPGPLVAAH